MTRQADTLPGVMTEGAAPTVEELRALLDPARMPRHVAVIMDGNGRWAANRGLPRVAGHKKGMDTARDLVRQCARLGLEALTLYAFSVENWRRPMDEVGALMSLLTLYLRKETASMMEDNVRFSTIGAVEELPKAARAWIDKTKAKTASNTGMVLNLALSYGGRREITDAAKRFARDVEAGRADASSLTEEGFAGYLDTSALPDPDLVIRTSGEMRVSNFLLWQIAYAELYFTESLWPEFDERAMLTAILDYQGRQRRFGKTGEQLGGKR